MKKESKTNVRHLLSGYIPPEGSSDPRVMAHLGDYCATRMSKQPIPWQWVTKIVNKKTTLPIEESPEVKRIKSKLARARIICQEVYGRDLLSIPGFGMRATTDDEDAGRHSYTKAANGVVRSGKKFLRVKGLIDTSKIKDKGLKDYIVNGNAASLLLEKKVLPALDRPKEEDEPLADEKDKE